MSARHASLRPTSKFLHTSLPTSAPPIFETTLLAPSPIPLNQGPSREPPNPNQLKPLYFVGDRLHLFGPSESLTIAQLPKILLPHQEAALSTRITSIEELITDEASILAKETDDVAVTVKSNRSRIEELSKKLESLKKQVKPVTKVEKDDFGRAPREEMDVDREEAGVQIRGDDGDVEVEY